jgi:hypothetical protein
LPEARIKNMNVINTVVAFYGPRYLTAAGYRAIKTSLSMVPPRSTGKSPVDDTGLCVGSALHPEGNKQRSFRLTRITLFVPQNEKRALREIDLDALKRSRSQ